MLRCNLRRAETSTVEDLKSPIMSRFINAILEMMYTRCARAHGRAGLCVNKNGIAARPQE